VIGAALIGATTAQAQQAPTVRIGGFMSVMYNWVNDDADKAGPPPAGVNGIGQASRSPHDFRNELEVHVFVNGKAANGLAYGAVIELQNDGFGGGGGGSIDTDEAYMFLSSPTLGTLRFGDEDNAASIMQVRVPTITGLGPDGDFDDNMLAASNALTSTGPSLLTGINDGNDATKIIYLSPQFFGFDFGVSYAPAASGEGERAWLGRGLDTLTAVGNPTLQRDRTTPRNELAGALRYRASFQNVGISAGFGAQRSDGASATQAGFTASNRNITAYTAGLQLTAYGFTVGGEYTWGNYTGVSVGRASLPNNPNGSKRDASSHWVLGATYVMGAWSFGGFFGIATQDNGDGFQDREQTVWGLGTAYTLAPGLELFASYNQLKDDNIRIGNQTETRDADVVLVGARLAF
jgi:predicted porin